MRLGLALRRPPALPTPLGRHLAVVDPLLVRRLVAQALLEGVAAGWARLLGSERGCRGQQQEVGQRTHRSGRIVEDDAQRVARARAHATDAVAHGDAVGAARALGRAVAGGEDHGLALAQRDHLRP
jgi:hypothetical protein